MRKWIGNRLSAKVFLLVFVALTICSALIYAAVMLVLPGRYQFVYDSRLQANSEAFFSTLEEQTYDEAVKQIYNFCIQNNSVGMLSGGERTLSFGEMKSGAAGNTSTTSIFGFIRFADRPEEYILSITSISQTPEEITGLFLKLIPAIVCGILLLSAFSAFLCSRIIVSPIAEISRISRRMTALDMTWRCTVKSSDETGILAQSLNTMAGRLQAAMEELESANHRLEMDVEHFRHLEAERRHFFAAVSHELKTPLTILKGQIENMMLGYGDYRNHEKYLPGAMETVLQIEALVREILSITKMENMEIKKTLREVSLCDTVAGAVKALGPLAQEKELQIHQNVDEGKMLTVNPALWQKALSNIIGNAVRYSPAGGEVSIFPRDENILVVENTGVTIPEEELPHLFTPFYRVERSRNRTTGGSGLGLYLVKTILELHGMTYCIHNTQNGVAFEIGLGA